MNKPLWAAMVTALLPSIAYAQTYLMSEKTKSLAHSYRDCVISSAVKLEAAGETARDTVEAARSTCPQYKLDIALSVVGDVEEKFPQTPIAGRTQLTKQSREYIDEEVTKSAILAVMRQRSEKK